MTTNEVVITIAQDGSAEALYFDDADIGFLGRKQIERASEIIFNEKSQDWTVVIPNLKAPQAWFNHFKGYDLARQFEVKFIHACRIEGIDFDSNQALGIANSIRQEMGL